MLKQQQFNVNHKRAANYHCQHSHTKKNTKIALKTEKHTQQIEELRILEEQKMKNEEQFSDSSSEVSLEEDLLEQHLSVINQKIEIYYNCPTIYNLSQTKPNSIFPKKQQTLKLDSLENYILKLAYSLHPQPTLIRNFLNYLKSEMKFRNLVRHIYYSFGTTISQELVQLIFKVWIMYFPYSTMSLSQNQIYSLAILIHKKMCQKIETLSKQSLGLTDSQKKNVSSKRRLYFILITTTLFVMQNIFKNPFYSGSKNKTQKGEDEAEQYELTGKLLKTSDYV